MATARISILSFTRRPWFRFIAAFAACILLVMALDRKWGSVPPIGRFFDPFTGFWQNADPVTMVEPGEIRIDGLSGPVQVEYDNHLIPHIFAGNESDLYRAVGYITARHRLWQMEFQTHAAAGRLSEVFGPVALDYDRLKRRQGMRETADATAARWMASDTTAGVIKAFTEGVNTYITQLGYRNLPIEYKLFDYRPEPWQPVKCAFLLTYMASMLSLGETDLENTHFIRQFGRETFDLLFPEFPAHADPIIPAATAWNFDATVPHAPDLDPLDALASNLPPYEKPSPLNGSNNWAVAGSRSATGYPLLANDMHLDLNLPSIWYLAQLQAPGLRVFGHIIPGIPVVIAGFNDSIAWGMTNAGRDLVDWYRIRFRDDSRQEYLHDGRWHETRKVVEEIRVRGSRPVYDTAVYTHHGPVVYDDRFPGSGQKSGLAMKWTGHQPSDELQTFLSLPKAAGYDDFRQAIRHFSNPPQNIVFAGAGGDIALHVQGRYPLRWPGQGKFILPGDTSAADWSGFIAFDQNPSVLNPHRGFVSSANQHPVDTLYPYYTYGSHYEHFRNRRINARLDTFINASPDDMKDLQLDTYSLQAAEALPVMLKAIRSEPGDTTHTAFLRELEGWDYRFEASSRAPALFNRWWRQLYRLAWDELTGGDPPLRLPSAYQTIQLMARKPDLSFWDIQSTDPTENLEQLVSTALDSAVREIGQWESRFGVAAWSRYQSTELRHLVPLLHTFGFRNLDTGGDGSAPNATTRYHGPSNRMVVALGPRPRAWCVYPGGQSGNPGSIHYGHFVPMWAKGRYAEMLYLAGPGTQDTSILFRQLLHP